MLSADKLVAMVTPDSSPVKRMLADAKDKGLLIDATNGRKTRTVLITNCGYVILSSINPEIIANRAKKGDNSISDINEEEDILL